MYILAVMMALLSLTGCQRSSNDVWEDSRTCGRHVGRGFQSLGGKQGDSRQVKNRDDFYGSADDEFAINDNDQDFIPLMDDQYSNEVAMADSWSPQPSETPGDPGSSIPSIEAFRDPRTIPGVGNVFRNISFDYNSNLVRGQNNLAVVRNAANYLKTHPNTYVFVEGHCDQRGPEAFNLALGSRRSNTVRNMLISEGVHPDQVFSISYGKERPLVMDNHEEAWAQNRRVEFKLYAR